MLAVGLGGAGLEARGVGAIRLAPVDLESARALVEAAGLTLAVDALARTLVALGRLALDHPQIAAVDVNPLILSDEGAVAVDALVVVAAASS